MWRSQLLLCEIVEIPPEMQFCLAFTQFALSLFLQSLRLVAADGELMQTASCCRRPSADMRVKFRDLYIQDILLGHFH